ncbi:MAG: hypothetical protein NTY13_06750 [Chlamydiae bacterium]|nr:hypothetical protein [Chlamydiota bacterium]
MDMIFCEDASQANTLHIAENLVMFRRTAMALIKQDIAEEIMSSQPSLFHALKRWSF